MKKLALVAIFLAAFGAFDVPRAFSQKTIDIYFTGSVVCEPSSCADTSGFVFEGAAFVLGDVTCEGGVVKPFSISLAVSIGVPEPCPQLYDAQVSVNYQETVTSSTVGCDTYVTYTDYFYTVGSVENLGDTFVWQVQSTTDGCNGYSYPGFVAGTRPC
jgi:hypothetical protein